MRARLIYSLLFAALSEFIWGQFPDHIPEPAESGRDIFYEHPNTAERIFKDSTGTYVIRFTYGMFEGWVPVDAEADEIRYSAFIEVFKLDNCVQTIIGHGFMGTYSPDGCIYDDAEYLISEARKIELRAYQTQD